MTTIEHDKVILQTNNHKYETQSNFENRGTSMSGFDTLIYMTGGALLGSSAVGILAQFVGLSDTDATRITGIVIGAIVVLVMRLKKLF